MSNDHKARPTDWLGTITGEPSKAFDNSAHVVTHSAATESIMVTAPLLPDAMPIPNSPGSLLTPFTTLPLTQELTQSSETLRDESLSALEDRSTVNATKYVHDVLNNALYGTESLGGAYSSPPMSRVASQEENQIKAAENTVLTELLSQAAPVASTEGEASRQPSDQMLGDTTRESEFNLEIFDQRPSSANEFLTHHSNQTSRLTTTRQGGHPMDIPNKDLQPSSRETESSWNALEQRSDIATTRSGFRSHSLDLGHQSSFPHTTHQAIPGMADETGPPPWFSREESPWLHSWEQQRELSRAAGVEIATNGRAYLERELNGGHQSTGVSQIEIYDRETRTDTAAEDTVGDDPLMPHSAIASARQDEDAPARFGEIGLDGNNTSAPSDCSCSVCSDCSDCLEDDSNHHQPSPTIQRCPHHVPENQIGSSTNDNFASCPEDCPYFDPDSTEPDPIDYQNPTARPEADMNPERSIYQGPLSDLGQTELYANNKDLEVYTNGEQQYIGRAVFSTPLPRATISNVRQTDGGSTIGRSGAFRVNDQNLFEDSVQFRSRTSKYDPTQKFGEQEELRNEDHPVQQNIKTSTPKTTKSPSKSIPKRKYATISDQENEQQEFLRRKEERKKKDENEMYQGLLAYKGRQRGWNGEREQERQKTLQREEEERDRQMGWYKEPAQAAPKARGRPKKKGKPDEEDLRKNLENGKNDCSSF
jgi:hypothetical protein